MKNKTFSIAVFLFSFLSISGYQNKHTGNEKTGIVIDHYRTGIITTQPNLDPLLVNRIAITNTNTEKNELIYFLNTLTDTTMTRNPRFAQ